MIVSFYDKEFKGLQNNASLVADSKTYQLIKRGIDFDSLRVVCEPYEEDIQPVFVVVKNDKGNYVYGALAGIPEITNENKTKLNGTDLKTMFNSDVVLNYGSYGDVNGVLGFIFAQWETQVNQSSFDVDIEYECGTVALSDLEPVEGINVYNAWEELKAYMKYYNLFMTSRIDLINKKVVFTVGLAMQNNRNVKLWELGIKNYGKWIASLNECQAEVVFDGTSNLGSKWILTSGNQITVTVGNRDIYPIKRKVIYKEVDSSDKIAEALAEANKEALTTLVGSMFNENIEISGVDADFETKFSVYTKRGGSLYKELPCGELHYNTNGLFKVQIGYRFLGLEFI